MFSIRAQRICGVSRDVDKALQNRLVPMLERRELHRFGSLLAV